MDKCVKCVDREITSNNIFQIEEIPDAVVSVPHLQNFTLANGSQIAGIATIRVCLSCRKNELRPTKVQPVQAVLLNPKGGNGAGS